MTTISRLLAAIALTLLLGLSAACGSDPDDGDSALPDAAGASSEAPADDDEPELDPEDAMLKFAQCMREHGVDMPDPEPGGGHPHRRRGPLPRTRWRPPQAACQKWMDMAEPEDGGAGAQRGGEAVLPGHGGVHARPRLQLPRPGRSTVAGSPRRSEKGDGDLPGPDDPRFQKDMEECSAEAGLEPPGDADGGSSDEQSS